MKGTAEVVGGGLAGLTAAVALARRGWSVRLHERADELREIGAGLYLKENSLRALEQIGVLDAALAKAVTLSQMDLVDTVSGRTVSRDVSSVRCRVALRTDLHRALTNAASAEGVELVTGSSGLGTSPDGRLTVTGDGADLGADLIVGADGIHSTIRDSVGLRKNVRTLREGATRLLVPRRPGEREARSVEYWSGRHRLLVTPCSPDDLYLALMGPEADARGSAAPIDVGRWVELFPEQAELLERIDPSTGTHHTNRAVQARGWSAGRVCIVGDAAHGQPPNLGQGAGLAMFNAVELARSLATARTIRDGLAEWEARCRPVATQVQQWSYWYGVVSYGWPTVIHPLRFDAIRAINRFGPTRRRFNRLWQGGIDQHSNDAAATSR